MKIKMMESKRGKAIFIGIVIVVVIVGTIVVIKMLNSPDAVADKEKKKLAADPSNPAKQLYAQETAKTAALSKTVPAGFPLRRGSTGSNVKKMQQALMKKDTTALPIYGADGIFGSETEAALKKNNLPVIVDETTYNQIINNLFPAVSGGTSAIGEIKVGDGVFAKKDNVTIYNILPPPEPSVGTANKLDYVGKVSSLDNSYNTLWYVVERRDGSKGKVIADTVIKIA